MNGCGRRRNRSWPEALKREIVAASYEAGASVSLVARRYDVNMNQLFSWRKLYRDGLLGPAGPALVPVAVAGEPMTAEGVAAKRDGSRLRCLAGIAFASAPASTARRSDGCSTRWRGDDPGSERHARLAGGWQDRYAPRDERLGAAGAASAGPRPACRRSVRFRGARGDLIKILWPSRTSSEPPSSTAPRPSISPFSFSRVRSDAGILSIGVLFR
jgi:transposase-like protein